MNATLRDQAALAADSNEVRASRLLGDLIAICRNSEETFRSAAERCECDGLRGHLMEQSHQRAGFVAALQTLQRHHGEGHVDESATVTGAIRRSWSEIRDALKAMSDETLLDRVEADEARVTQAYRAIYEDFPKGLFPADAAVLAFHLRHFSRSQDSIHLWQLRKTA